MFLSRPLGAALVAAATAAHAQSPGSPAGASPAPQIRYESAFTDYRPYADVEIDSWKKANGVAAALGGHMGHVRREVMPAPGPQPGTAPTLPGAPVAAPTGHAGHAK